MASAADSPETEPRPPANPEQETVVLRKVAAAVLAVPIIAILYLPVLARRSIAARLALLGSVGIVVAVATVEPEIDKQLGDAGHDPDELRELTVERQTARGSGLVDRSRDDEALPALAERPIGGDQRPTPAASLHDDGRIRQPGDQPVPLRERPAARSGIRKQLGDDRAAGPNDVSGETDMRPRVEALVT